MKIRIRDAKDRDLGLFRKLLDEFLTDPDNENFLVEADSDETKFYFDEMFKTSVDLDDSFVIFVADKACLAACSLRAGVKFKQGFVATIWMAHVSKDVRDEGIEEALFKEAKKRLNSLGFDAITFASPSVGKWVETAEEIGFEPFMLHQILKLEGDEDELD